MFLLVWRSEPLFHFSTQSRVLFLSASRAITCLRFGVQSRVLFLHGIQSHCLSSFRRSEPCFVSIWHSEPCFTLFGVQSRVLLHLVFRAICLRFGIQSHVLLRSTFRATSSFDIQSYVFIRRSEPSSLLSLTFRVTFSVSAFRAIIDFLFGVQSRMVILVFRAITHHPFWPSEPSLIFVQAFRAITHLLFGVQSRMVILVFKAITHLHSTFRAIASFISAFRAMFCFVRCSESHIRFDIQSHRLSSFRRSEPLLIFYLAFRAAWSSRYSESLLIFIRRSDPLHHSFQHLEPCFALFGVRSHIFISTFRAIASPRSGVQSHYSSSI